MKKNILVLVLVALCISVAAQSKKELRKQRYEQLVAKRDSFLIARKNADMGAGQQVAAIHLQNAAKDYNISTATMLIGGGIGAGVAALSTKNNAAIGYVVMGAAGLVGIVFRFIGNHELKLAGNALSTKKISVEGNGVSFNF